MTRIIKGDRHYRDSPTETPFRKMVTDMADAAKEIVSDPINEVQDSCAVCGIGVTVPLQHDVDMCGACYTALKDYPPITYISDGHGVTRAFTFGSDIDRYTVTMSYTELGSLARFLIGEALAVKYRGATEGSPAA